MSVLFLTALAACACLAFQFFRLERDKFLNYRAGQALRAWVTSNVEPILTDDDATAVAQRCARQILAATYDRARLSKIASAARTGQEPHPPWQQMGLHTDIIRSAMKYVAALAVLEKRGAGSHLRYFLMQDEPAPLNFADEETEAASTPGEVGATFAHPNAAPTPTTELVAAIAGASEFHRMDQATGRTMLEVDAIAGTSKFQLVEQEAERTLLEAA